MQKNRQTDGRGRDNRYTVQTRDNRQTDYIGQGYQADRCRKQTDGRKGRDNRQKDEGQRTFRRAGMTGRQMQKNR
jgi:hypothetical protein